MKKPSRAAEITLTLDAAIEDVWKALTDARELTRWFPLQAAVQSAVGGSVAWRWDEHFAMVSRIDNWQPPRLLRLIQERESPHAADGAPLADASAAQVVIEFTLDTHRGQTRLRLVHSGFGSGAAWDDELEGVTNGWNYELRALAHYLAHHRGRDRHFGWAWTTTSRAQADVWEALTSQGGMALPRPSRDADSPFSLTTPDRVTLSGISRLHVPQREWFGTSTELDNGLVRLSTWRGGGRTGVNVWFSTWSPDCAARASTLGQSAQRFLDAQIRQARHPGGSQEADIMVHVSRFVTIIAGLSLTALVASPGPAGPSAAPIAKADARAAFERLRAISGTWTFTTDMDHGRVSYELVSNGTVILERVTNEEHGESGMVSMIYLDGDRLILQHYCSSGNQPRLASAGLEGDEVRFTFERASNLASPDAGHIHGAVFTFAGTGPFASRWTWRENGIDTTSTRRHAR